MDSFTLCFPYRFPMDVLEVKREPKICNYIDIPLQHFRFNLKIHASRNNSENNQIIKRFSCSSSRIAIRTTLIVGYPGETQEDFNILKDWVQEMKFDRMVVCLFS
jgi:ribosomal protein S12 methylthiotransferase